MNYTIYFKIYKIDANKQNTKEVKPTFDSIILKLFIVISFFYTAKQIEHFSFTHQLVYLV